MTDASAWGRDRDGYRERIDVPSGFGGARYRDGSCHLEARPAGAGASLFAGPNDRLFAVRDRAHKGGVNRNAAARALHFIEPGHDYAGHFVIDGDLGRMFPPQPWAAGTLPAIGTWRFSAFLNGANPDVFRYRPPTGPDAAPVIAACTWYLLRGWSSGDFVRPMHRPRDLLWPLWAMGYEGLTVAELHHAVATHLPAGTIRTYMCKLPPTHTARANAWALALTAAARTCGEMLAERFTPYALVARREDVERADAPR